MNTWLALLPPLIAIAMAIWSKRIIPSLLVGLMAGSYLLHPTLTGGFGGTVDKIVGTLTDKGNLQVLLFLYLFSGLIGIVKRSGGVTGFSTIVEKHIKSENGVLLTMWALIPVTFIDCGFRVVGAGSITLPLAEKYRISRERLAFMLNNTASPVVELIPIATTFVGFNVAIVAQGLKTAGIAGNTSAYAIWLRAIPLEFFSIVVLVITFASIFIPFKRLPHSPKTAHGESGGGKMTMNMQVAQPVIEARVINLIVPMVSVIVLSIFFFWFFGSAGAKRISILAAIADSEPNRAMLAALVVTLAITAVCYFAQKYSVRQQTEDVISGGNDIMTTLVILSLAWSLAAVSQDLGLNALIKLELGNSLPGWSVPVSLFLLASAVTYFTGSGWGAASLIMPFAIPLAASAGSGIPLCVAAVITGGTFGDVTSPVAGMTNMSSNIVHADHGRYIAYAGPMNFSAAAIAALLFVLTGIFQ